MTVAKLPRVNEYVGVNGPMSFPIRFQFLSASDISVKLRDAEGAESDAAGFSVSGGDGAKGAVVFATGTAGYTVVIRGRTEISQKTEYPYGNNFPSFNHQRAMDRAAMIDQEQQDQIDDHLQRSLSLPAGQALKDLTGDRPGRFIGFGADPTQPLMLNGGGADPALRKDLADPQVGAKAVAYGVRPLDRKLGDLYSVCDAGAIGDGVTDNTAAIAIANVLAAAAGKDLYFPAGVYKTNLVLGLTSWKGERGTVIQYIGNGTGFIPLVTFQNLVDVSVEGIIFDGNVSADPVSWATGYNGFTGAAGVSFIACARPKVVNCGARNISWSGFRFVNCTDVVLERSVARRMRGNFGDGAIFISCLGVAISTFVATDYTRIGCVGDSFGSGSSIVTCQKVTLTNVFCYNGHHASALFGGAEFNVGIWFENSGDIALDKCFAWDNTHRNINLCTGPKQSNFPGSHALMTLVNCQTDGGVWGIYTYSLNDLPVIAKISNCSAKRATFSFFADARNPSDSYAWTNVHADYNASINVGRGFGTVVSTAAGKPSFYVGGGSTVTRWQTDQSLLDAEDGSASTADVGTEVAPAGPMTLKVDGLTNPYGLPVVVKWFGNFAHDVAISGHMKLAVRRGGSQGGSVAVAHCTVVRLNLADGHARVMMIHANEVLGPVYGKAMEGSFKANTVQYVDGSEVWLDSDAPAKYPAWDVDGNRFSKPAGLGSVLRLGFGQQAWQVLLTGNKFLNTGAPEASNPFVRYASGVLRAWAANFADASVTNMTMLDSGGGVEADVAGVQRLAMH